jgi:hypothetical protein
MLPTAMIVAVLSIPGPPTQLGVDFDAMPVRFAVPGTDGETVPVLRGGVRVLDALGRATTTDGVLDIMLESEGTDEAGKQLVPEVFRFDPTGLAKSKQDGERYATLLPWPKGWPAGCEIQMWVQFAPADKGPKLVTGPLKLKAKVMH